MSSNYLKKHTLEKHPKMLKEFLQETNTTNPSNPSCSSSSGFKSFPRCLGKSDPTIQILLDEASATLPRTRSSRSRPALSSFRKLINAVKSLQRSTTSSTPLTLSRSFSKSLLDRFSSKKKMSKPKSNDGVMKIVKIKDILRWRSFCDVQVAEELAPLDSSTYEYDDVVHSNDTTTSKGDNNCDMIFWEDKTMTTSDSNSNGCELESELSLRSSWGGESEFYSTMDELPCWWGNLIEEGKKWDETNDAFATFSDVAPEEVDNCIIMEDEKEQHSPVSVLDSPFRDETSDQEFESSFEKSFANMERTRQNLLQRIQWLESLAGVSENDDETEFMQEEEEEEDSRKEDNAMKEETKVKKSRAVGKLIRERPGFEDREVCIKEMEQQGHWSKFEEEKGELGVELELQLLSDLVNEVLVDLKVSRV